MEQKIYNLESKINILYDFIYNLNTIDCFSFEEIITETITIDDIKISLIDNNKDSKQDIEIYNNYKTDILNTRFKITAFNNDTKQIILKRYSDDYPVSIKINFYKYNDTKINSLDTPINNDSLLSYLLSQLVLNKETNHILLPILNIDMLFTDIEHIIKTDNCYEKIIFAINNNEISNICCLQLREQFFKIMVLEDYLSKNKCSYKGLIFQVVHTLAVLQTKYPGFRHNNLLLKNIVIYLKKPNDEYIIYNNFNKKSHEKFYVPNIGFDIKITNFENTIIPNLHGSSHATHIQRNNTNKDSIGSLDKKSMIFPSKRATIRDSIGSFNKNDPNIKFADQHNPYYDIYTFFNDFINTVKKDLSEKTSCNIETLEFFNKFIPEHLRDATIGKSTESNSDKFNKNYNIVSPVDLLNDKYFDEFKKKPDQVVNNTRMISHNYFTGIQQYTTVLDSDNYSILGQQDNLISKYNIMIPKYKNMDILSDTRSIHTETQNIVKLRRLNNITNNRTLDIGGGFNKKKYNLTGGNNNMNGTRNVRISDITHTNNMLGGTNVLSSSSNIVQSTSYKKEKNTPFVSNAERSIYKSSSLENKIKEPPVILEQKIYDTAQKPAAKSQFPPSYIPLYDVEGVPQNLLPYTKMIHQPPIQKVYNISLSNPLVNHTSINNVYEDTLPSEIHALTSSTLNDRCQIITFLRNILLEKQDGEIMNVTGGNNSLLSYIKLLDVNPYTKYQFSSLASDFLLYNGAYPIRFDIETRIIKLSKNAMGINLRIYMMSVGDLLIDAIDNTIKRHHFDLWRELDYYEWVKQTINKKVSPNFISPILYKIDDESFINWEQLKDIRQKNAININVIKTINNQSINQKHNLMANNTYFPALKSLYNPSRTSLASPFVINTTQDGKLDLTQNSGQSLILLTEAPTTSFEDWFKPQHDEYGSVKKMTSTGHHSSEVWKSILFQLIYAMAVLQKSQIYIMHLSLDNVFIKDINVNQNSVGSWIYKVDNIDYYIPNYGFILLIDTKYEDINQSKIPSHIISETGSKPIPPSVDMNPIIAASITAAKYVNRNTGMPADHISEIVRVAYETVGQQSASSISNLGISTVPINRPNTQPKIYKIYGKIYEDTDPVSKSLCSPTTPPTTPPTGPTIIHDLILEQLCNIMDPNKFSSISQDIPSDIINLIINIHTECKNNKNISIQELIPKYFSIYLHNRVGTYVLKSEKEHIPTSSNFSPKKQSLIIWQERADEYKWAIYKDDQTGNPYYHNIIINRQGEIQCVHATILYLYPPSEQILPKSTTTLKYDETHIFETYNLDNI